MSFGEVSKKVSELWNKLSDSEKQSYTDQHNRLQDEINTNGPTQVKQEKQRKNKKQRRDSDNDSDQNDMTFEVAAAPTSITMKEEDIES